MSSRLSRLGGPPGQEDHGCLSQIIGTSALSSLMCRPYKGLDPKDAMDDSLLLRLPHFHTTTTTIKERKEGRKEKRGKLFFLLSDISRGLDMELSLPLKKRKPYNIYVKERVDNKRNVHDQLYTSNLFLPPLLLWHFLINKMWPRFKKK